MFGGCGEIYKEWEIDVLWAEFCDLVSWITVSVSRTKSCNTDLPQQDWPKSCKLRNSLQLQSCSREFLKKLCQSWSGPGWWHSQMVKKVQFDPGAVLDRVISSAEPEDECYLYKLADFKKSGQLVEAFNTTGSKVRI